MLHPNEKVNINVPVHFNGTARGVRNGGVQQEFVHRIAIRCLPKDLPNYLSIDVTDMKIGQSILVRDLDSEGVELMAPADSTLVSIRRPRLVIVLDEDEDEEGAEGC